MSTPSAVRIGDEAVVPPQHRPAFAWVAVLVACLPAVLGRALIGAIAEAPAGPFPYFVPDRAAQLYLAAPLIVLSSFVLFLAPGTVLARRFFAPAGTPATLLYGFGVSICLSMLVTAAHALSSVPWSSLWTWVALTGATVLLGRSAIAVPRSAGRRRLAAMAGAVYAGVVLLLPKLFWENFNLDGLEAFEFARSLTHHAVPHWELHRGIFGFYINFFSFAYPNAWFISLFGPFEASVRLPYLLYVVVIFAGLLALVEHGRARRLRGIEEALLWAALAVFTVVQSFNTTYEPFFADLAEPGATDTLLVACFLGCMYALFTGRAVAFYIFGALTYGASAGGLLLLLALGGAVLLSSAEHKRTYLRSLAILVGGCVAAGILHQTLYATLVLGGAKDQFSARNLLSRLYPPRFTEFARFNAILFPTGILPLLSFVFVRRSDLVAWCAALTTAAYFAVIYVQTWTSLHQFTLVMLLPLIVFWRVYGQWPSAWQRAALPLLAAATGLSFWLSLPQHFAINTDARDIGARTSYGIGDYGSQYPQALAAADLLYAAFPHDYRLQYPHQPFGLDPGVWVHYAFRAKPAAAATPTYLMLPAALPPPPGAECVGRNDTAALYVQDRQRWLADRNRQTPRVSQSPLYEPLIRQTSAFFRAYAERQRRKAAAKQ